MDRVRNLDAYVSENDWIEYGGPYKSPNDLSQLYGQVDIVWICCTYEVRKMGNWMFARANRFYEACCYKRPMIARTSTADACVVEERAIGLCIDLSDVRGCVEQILAISPEQLQLWRENMDKVTRDIYFYTDEHQRLLDIIDSAGSSKLAVESGD